MKYEWLDDCPDIHHTFYSIAALSLTNPEAGLEEIDPLLALGAIWANLLQKRWIPPAISWISIIATHGSML